jgi:hypothetical protein
MRNLIIKLLFRLLKVDFNTKNLIPYSDLKKIKPEEASVVIEELELKYNKALAGAYHSPYFTEWLYLQITTLRNEHIYTNDKDKKDVQIGGILFAVRLIEEMKLADNKLNRKSRRA